MILSDHRERPDDTESTSCSAQRTNSTRRVNALEAGGGWKASAHQKKWYLPISVALTYPNPS